jgi:hypothetical protein
MRRRHMAATDGAPLCLQRRKHAPLEFAIDWRGVTCEQCHVRRFLKAKKHYDQRKAQELARAARPVPLLEGTVERAPIDNQPPFPTAPRPGPIIEAPPPEVELVMHRLAGLEAMLSNLSDLLCKLRGSLALVDAKVTKLEKETQARDGATQAMVTALRDVVIHNLPVRLEGTVDGFFGSRRVELVPRVVGEGGESNGR